MYNEIITSVVKYFARLEGICNNSLVQKVYTESKSLNNRVGTIISFLEENINYTRGEIDLHNRKELKRYTRDMKKYVKFYFENIFFTFLHSDGNKKLSTYRFFKQRYYCEPYLKHVTDPFIRKDVTCLRISAHNLKIEAGRYNNIERNKRTCSICNSGEIEDEFHFMMQCSGYKDIRNKYLEPIWMKISNIHDIWDKFIYIMQSDDIDVIGRYSCYIQEASSKRKCQT